MPGIIPNRIIEDIRAQNDIAEVVGSYLPLKRAGSAFKALCPFHKEKTPSFSVNPQRQIYHCFGCGVGGDVFKFVMEYEGVDFSTAARLLARRVGIHVETTEGEKREGSDKDLLYRIHEEVTSMFHRALQETRGAEAAREYLKDRDLTDEAIDAFRLGFAPDRWDTLLLWGGKHGYSPAQLERAGLVTHREEGSQGSSSHYDRFRNRLMFPIRDELGRVIGFSGRILREGDKTAKYVNSPETLLFKKSRVLYALDKARRAIVDSRTAVLCEGQIDVIRCHLAGLDNAVAPQGTAVTEDHARLLKRYAEDVVLVFDADRAGEDAAQRSAEVCLAAGMTVRIAAMPAGQDPDSLIRKAGPQAFQELLEQARSLLVYRVDVLRSREDLTQESGQRRVTRAALNTIRLAPSDTQRDQMLQQAAQLLGLHPDALRRDLREAGWQRPSGAAPATERPQPTVEHPREEVLLAQLLTIHKDLAELVRTYLPEEALTDPDCRKIINELLQNPDQEKGNLLTALTDEGGECLRLAAELLATPRKPTGDGKTHQDAARDCILKIRKRALERQRSDLRRRMEAAPAQEQERLEMEFKQLILDLYDIRQGWEKALPILEL